MEGCTVLKKLRACCDFLLKVFLELANEIQVKLNIERPLKNQEVQSYRDDPIGDSSLTPQSESPRP